MNIPNRVYFSLNALACFGLLAFGYYLQYFEQLDPCPMCILQRICYFIIGVVAFIAACHAPQRLGVLVYGSLILLAAAVGAGIAGRQTWLQHLPPELVPECGPGLEFMLEMYPLLETLSRTLKGTGDCAEVSWRFLSFSIAEWSLVCFIGLAIAALWQAITALKAPGNA